MPSAATPPSLRILASWAGVIPPGTAAMRSGTNCCPGAAELAGPEVGPEVGPDGDTAPGKEADETCEEGGPPAGDTTDASAAWTADTATPTDSTAAVRATRRRDNDSTMYMTI